MDKLIPEEGSKKTEYLITKIKEIEVDRKKDEELSWDLMLLSDIEEE